MYLLWNYDRVTLRSHFLLTAGGLLIDTQYFYLFTNWQRRRLKVRRCRTVAAFTRNCWRGKAQRTTEAKCDNAGTSGRSRDSTIQARNWLVYKSICDVCVRHGKLDLKRSSPAHCGSSAHMSENDTNRASLSGYEYQNYHP